MNSWVNVIKVFLDITAVFFILYMLGYSTFQFLSVMIGSVTLNQRKMEYLLLNHFDKKQYIPVTLIVPAYNEEVTVVNTVQTLLELDYPTYEIIVVNDGSKDATAQKLIDAFELYPINRPFQLQLPCKPVESVYESHKYKVHITLINKQNGGKADSLNMGINASSFPYFICMDADSALQYDSLSKIVQPILEDDSIMAVGGMVRPCNDMKISKGRVTEYRLPKNILACMQVLEYDRSFLAARILFDKFNGSLIISGAFGLFRKDIVIQCGGYNTSTMGEDMELVVRLHEYCLSNHMLYRIRYAPDAICWTQVPERLKDLCKQRRRWHIGLRQTMLAHGSMAVHAEYGPVSFISYTYFLLYELFSPLIELFGLLTIALAYAVDQLNLPYMILFFLIYAGFGAVMSLVAFFTRTQTLDLKLSFSDIMKALLLCLFEVTVLRFIMATVRMRALFASRKNLTWGKIERKKMDVS